MAKKTQAAEAATAALPPVPTAEHMASYAKRRLDRRNRQWLRDTLLDALFKEKIKRNHAAARELLPAILEHIHGAANMKLWNSIPLGMIHHYHLENETYAQLTPAQQKRVEDALGSMAYTWKLVFGGYDDRRRLPGMGNEANREPLPTALGDKVVLLLIEHRTLDTQHRALLGQLTHVLSGCRTLAAAVNAVPDLFTILGPEQLDTIVEPATKPRPLVAKAVSCLIGQVLGVQREGCTADGKIAA